jgi:DNA-binding NtrC family response regulator
MKATLLIIAEDVCLRWNLSGRLREEGYTVFEAGQEGEAKKILSKENVDVVLVSLGDCKDEELSLIKMARKAGSNREVIILNRSNQLSLSMEVMKLGAFDDLLYPFDLSLLVRRIEEACELRKKRRSIAKSLFRRYEEAMVAASFAEAGELETAREFLKMGKKHLRIKNNQKKEKEQATVPRRLSLKKKGLHQRENLIQRGGQGEMFSKWNLTSGEV